MNIRKLLRGEVIPYDLLFLADPSKRMVDQYIFDSMVYIAEEDNTQIVGVCVLYPIDNSVAEIKSVAVAEDYQGRGIGKQLLMYAEDMARKKGYEKLQIGTANNGFLQLEIYQKLGFEMTSIKPDFFIDNYDEVMIENGLQCKHMIMLSKDL